MATRVKSIRVPVNFGAPADQADNTITTLATPTIFTPENEAGNPITFESAMLFVTWQNTAVAGIAAFTATIQLGAAGTTTQNAATSFTNSGEDIGLLMGPFDFTSYFNTNFGTGTSQTCLVRTTIDVSTGASRAVYAYWELTYTYNDATTTGKRIQTICVPYESGTGNLTTTANTTFATMPQLSGSGGWLENHANPVVRHRWMEVKGNFNNNGGTTDVTLSFRFDTGSTSTLPVREGGSAADTWQLYQIDASALTTTDTHTFQIWSGTANRWANLIVSEWIVYEFDVSGTTEVLNYAELPIEFTSPIPASSATAHRARRNFLLPEPDTITMLNCAVEISYNAAASATIQIKAGDQASYRGYAMAASVTAGQFSFQHRLDSDSASGAALTLARGVNPITVDLYESAGAAYNMGGVIKLLYKSGVSALGVDAHTKVVHGLMIPYTFTLKGEDIVTDKSFSIPESSFWLQAIMIRYTLWAQTALMTLGVQAEVLPGEAEGAGWKDLYIDTYVSDNELGYTDWVVRAGEFFKRYPNQPDSSLLDLESARDIRTFLTTTSRFGAKFTITYHSINYDVDVDISVFGGPGGVTSNNTLFLYSQEGNGATVQYSLFDKKNGIGDDGTYTFKVYDDTKKYISVFYFDNTYKGVSQLAFPGGTFQILPTSGSSGGPCGEYFF